MVALSLASFRVNPKMSRKKRQRHQPDEEEEEGLENDKHEDDEMMIEEDDDDDVGDEEMDGQEDDEQEEEEDDEDDANDREETAQSSFRSSPFLDAFYGLAATEPRERAVAAQTILLHIQQTPSDAPYAWGRLLRGLGSGRAAARQGYASALSALIKIGLQSDLLDNLQSHDQQQAKKATKDEEHPVVEDDHKEEEVTDPIDYIRQRLLAATQAPTGRKKKGSDERDAYFGRLFGIVAVIRSGIFRESASRDQTALWLQDLCALYRTKQWMREPAAHAICLLLQSMGGDKVDVPLVTDVIIPELLTKGDNETRAMKGKSSSFLSTLSAEQVALALYIQQALTKKSMSLLPSPWKEALLTRDTIPVLAPILASTSHVTQPRTHLVWDVVALALSETAESTQTKSVVDQRILSHSLSPDILPTLFRSILEEQLLGMSALNSTENKEEKSQKATDDRRALALGLVRQWAGVEFVSSLTGRTQLQVPSAILRSTVLAPFLVKRLFIDLLATKDHYLKPLASRVIDQIGERAVSSPIEQRMAVVEALLAASSRFDGQSKTSTVATVLGWESELSEDHEAIWEKTFDFCQGQLLTVSSSNKKVGDVQKGVTSYEAAGLIDLLFHHGKVLVRRIYAVDNGNLKDTERSSVISVVQKLIGFFETTAFFDCSGVVGKKNASIVVQQAVRIKAQKIMFPYELRCVISSRFYSLLAERVTADLHSAGLPAAVGTIQGCLNDLQSLTKAGARSFASNSEKMEDDEAPSAEDIVKRLKKLSDSVGVEPSKGKETFFLAANLLSSLLYLHLLDCGAPENLYEDEDPDVDTSEDREEAENFMQDVDDVVRLFRESDASETDANPLASLATLCVNIFSSPLASGSHLRGASPKMLREAVRQLWIQGLMTASQANIKADPELLGILLDALGAKAEQPENVDEDSENDEDEDDEGDNDDGIFAKAALLDVDAEMKDEENDSDYGSKENDDNDMGESISEDEVEVDRSKLQSLLQEDDDASVDAGELEHHAGADAALARLIQLKQDARKAGQKAREKIELAKNIRCVMLLEVLLMGKPDGWGSLLSPGFILSTLTPLLDRRRALERDLTKLTQKTQDSTGGEKRSLIDKVTALLRQKVLKAKLASFSWSSKADSKELVLEISRMLLKAAKDRNSKDHDSLVASSLVFTTKALPAMGDKIDVAREIYAGAIEEWASKKSSRLDSRLFEDLVHQASQVAQAALIKPLAVAALNGKTPFIKTEAFRILSLVLNPKLQLTIEMDETVLSCMKEAVDDVLGAIAAALGDADMKRAKRARDILKTLERLIEFMETTKCYPSKSKVVATKNAMESLGTDSESQGLKTLCDKLAPRLEAFESSCEDPDVEDTTTSAKKSKKAKKKKGKKKR